MGLFPFKYIERSDNRFFFISNRTRAEFDLKDEEVNYATEQTLEEYETLKNVDAPKFIEKVHLNKDETRLYLLSEGDPSKLKLLGQTNYWEIRKYYYLKRVEMLNGLLYEIERLKGLKKK
jgi:hypothetical protein